MGNNTTHTYDTGIANSDPGENDRTGSNDTILSYYGSGNITTTVIMCNNHCLCKNSRTFSYFNPSNPFIKRCSMRYYTTAFYIMAIDISVSPYFYFRGDKPCFSSNPTY